MKRLFLVLSTVLFGCVAAGAQIRSQVDERFELTSISFRLAGIPEYSQCAIPSYAGEIDTYFKPYADSELTKFIRELRSEHHVAYNALPAVAALLEIKNGKVRLQPQYDIADIAKADGRWSRETFSQYLKLLDKFYRESNFRRFFDGHREQYALVEEQLNAWTAEIKTEWFESFFGRAFDPNIGIYVSLANGPHNYAFDQGILLGAGGFNHYTTYIVLHELCHHYVNPLFFAHWPAMETAADKIFPAVQQQMMERAYGTASTTMLEWLNNLCVLMYAKEHHNYDGSLPVWTRLNTENGFIWMPRSVEFMDNFYGDRASYPHLADFMPQLVAFLSYTADHLDTVRQEFERRHPYVTGVFPLPGSDISNEKEIRIRFSEPMRTDCKGVYNIDDENIEWIPNNIDSSYWKDDRTFVLLIPTDSLKPNRIYGISLPQIAFLSDKDYKLDKDNELIFNTGGGK